jgi:hypothetical protein
MSRCRSLFLLFVIGCGGRDPLLGAVDDGTSPPPPVGVDASGVGSLRDAAPGTKPPFTGPDAGAVPPPAMAPDAAGPAKRDAATAPPPANACVFPSCLSALVAACTPSGSCVQQQTMSGQGIGTNVCHANGVKVVTTLSGGGGMLSASVRVLKPDGTACYTLEPQSGRQRGVIALTYRGPNGETLATATLDGMFLAIVCAGQTTPQIVSSSCQPGLMTGRSMCTNGACM